MALSQADLAAAYKVGLHYGTLNGAGAVIECHQFFGSAVKANPTNGKGSVAIIAADGTFTVRDSTIAGTHDFGVPR